MTANGFLEQKRNSPLGFGTVLVLHGAVIAAVVLLKGPGFIMEREVITTTFDVPPAVEPLPNPPPPTAEPHLRTPPPQT